MDFRRMGVLKKIGECIAEKTGIPGERISYKEAVWKDGSTKIGIRVGTGSSEGPSPFYNLEKDVEEVICGNKTEEDVAEEVAAMVKRFDDMNVGGSLNRDYILDHCRTKIVSSERNLDVLKECPHNWICDLAELVVVPVYGDGNKPQGFINVNNMLLENFEISEEELFEAARENVKKELYYCGMTSILSPLIGIDEQDDEDEMMFVVTNKDKIYGAAAMGCPDIMKEIRDKIGVDVYVIPSSIHEAILVKKMDEEDMKDIAAIIKNVNETQVADDEVLSDHLYAMDEEGNLYIAA